MLSQDAKWAGVRRLKNVTRNGVKAKYLTEMGRKLLSRLADRDGGSERDEAVRWCESVVEDFDQFAQRRDADLWHDSKVFGDALEQKAHRTLSKIGPTLGGGGNYPLLHFLVLLRRPAVAVETGVAAGFSTQAILAAMEKNRHGKLYSNVFPMSDSRTLNSTSAFSSMRPSKTGGSCSLVVTARIWLRSSAKRVRSISFTTTRTRAAQGAGS